MVCSSATSVDFVGSSPCFLVRATTVFHTSPQAGEMNLACRNLKTSDTVSNASRLRIIAASIVSLCVFSSGGR